MWSGSLPCSSHSDHAVALQQPRAALDGFDLDAFDVELDQVFSVRRNLAVVDQIVERDDRHVLAAAAGVAGDAERLVLGAGQPRGPARRADRAFHQLKAVAVDLGVVRELGEILRRRLDRDRLVRAERRARDQHRPVAVIGAAIEQRVVDVDGIAKQQLQLVLVTVRAIEQLAPVAVAIGKFERRIGIEFDRDVALGQRLAQQIGATDVAAMRKVRRNFRARRQRQRGRALPQVGSLESPRSPVKLDGRLRDHRSTSPNTISSEPRMAETSARRWPRQMKSIACRCAKPGARILHL